MKYKVLSAEKKKDWSGQHGPMTSWTVVLQDDQGTIVTAEQNTKAGSPQPAGEVEGSLEDGVYSKKFKKSQEQRSFGRSPEDQRSIIRQHSQEMALRFLALVEGPMKHSAETKAELLKTVFVLADKFELDAQNKPAEAKIEGKVDDAPFGEPPDDTRYGD